MNNEGQKNKNRETKEASSSQTPEFGQLGSEAVAGTTWAPRAAAGREAVSSRLGCSETPLTVRIPQQIEGAERHSVNTRHGKRFSKIRESR